MSEHEGFALSTESVVPPDMPTLFVLETARKVREQGAGRSTPLEARCSPKWAAMLDADRLQEHDVYVVADEEMPGDQVLVGPPRELQG